MATLNSQATVSECPGLWFEDGNIVIRTTSTQEPLIRTLFKVHKFILSTHCTAFSDLFSGGPQTALEIASERHGDLPIMDLPDDENDVKHFLKALYYPDETQQHLPTSFDGRPKIDGAFPPSYAGVLRLATKYDAQKIRKVVVRALQMQWPMLLSEWNAVQDSYVVPETEALMAGETDLSHIHADPAHAIRLGTDLDVPAILPVAYYDLMSIYELQSPDAAEAGESRQAELSVLTNAELHRLLVGRGALRAWVRQRMIAPLRTVLPHSACALDGACAKTLQAKLGEFRTGLSGGTYACDPVAWLKTASEVCMLGTRDEVACVHCKSAARDCLMGLRYELWTKLPQLFRLDHLVPAGWGQEYEVQF
ncbi:hypothetical protein BV25DRAFT_1719423 [Artomyces pyxidatus]|uniref:Uncharacterized protein n=1 Tax=Artomyces pyxidatus TaxID=48021 RepID=A0ACB8SIX7_9AGAM|nr:hypothetical protein BV25DRAFT_1719423 [Artomyces pyxidatus]